MEARKKREKHYAQRGKAGRQVGNPVPVLVKDEEEARFSAQEGNLVQALAPARRS